MENRCVSAVSQSLARWAVGLWLSFALVACASNQESIVPTRAKAPLTEAAIDADPLALLPGDAIIFGRLKVAPLLASELGRPLLAAVQPYLALPEGLGLLPQRDVAELLVGIYSMQGADVAGIAVGSFDRAAVERAQLGAAGSSAPITVSPYAGHTIYTAHNVGFTILTNRTALLGTETGIRRVLDRIAEGRTGRRLPRALEELLSNQKADVCVGGDLRVNTFSSGLREQLPFLRDLEATRILGNFSAPGLNLAGSLGYVSPETAAAAGQSLRGFSSLLSSSQLLLGFFGVLQPIRRLEAEVVGTEVNVVAAVDGATLAKMLTSLTIPNPSSATPVAVPAQLSGGVR